MAATKKTATTKSASTTKKATASSKKTEEQKKAQELREKRKSAFYKTLADVDKDLKKSKKTDDSIVSLLDDRPQVEVKRFSSGSFVLDTITGGGFPYGRIIELYGPESSGKTSIALNAVADVQHNGGNVVFFDAENAFDPRYARTLGVDTSTLGFSQEQTAEDIFNAVVRLINSGDVDLIVIDSLASLTTRAEAAGGLDKQQMGALARVMSKGLRLLVGPAANHNCTVIFTNQIREKVGVMFGNPETTTGGRALKFYASQRIEVRKRQQVKEQGEVIGTQVRLKVIKNKVAQPFGEGYTVLTFAKGINHAGELIESGLDAGVITQKNAQSAMYYKPLQPIDKDLSDDEVEQAKDDNGTVMYKLPRGKNNAIEALEKNKPLYKAISKDLGTVLDEIRDGKKVKASDLRGKEGDDNKDDFDQL